MSDTTGPISTLPGSGHDVPDGMMCDDHPDRPATHRVQGETDPFGCEMIDMCDDCFAAYREDKKTWDTSGECEWCKKHAPKLRDKRDYEEGLYGRVYQVCDACAKRYYDRVRLPRRSVRLFSFWPYRRTSPINVLDSSGGSLQLHYKPFVACRLPLRRSAQRGVPASDLVNMDFPILLLGRR